MSQSPLKNSDMITWWYLFLATVLVVSPVFTRADTNSPSQLRPWLEYRTIMWIGDSAYQKPDKIPLFFQRMRELGINTAMVSGDADPDVMLTNHFPYYVENMVNRGLCLKYNSKGAAIGSCFVTGLGFKSGRPESALVAPIIAWMTPYGGRTRAGKCRGSMPQEHGGMRQIDSYDFAGRKNLYCTTFSANPFDYDFNPIALGNFAKWLKTQYRDLAGIKRGWWQTDFYAHGAM